VLPPSNNTLNSSATASSDAEHAEEVGFYFEYETEPAIKAEVITVNEPKTLKAVVPVILSLGRSYYLRTVTQDSSKTSGYTLKKLREIRLDFKLKLFKREAPIT
jgi:hypothetical protein